MGVDNPERPFWLLLQPEAPISVRAYGRAVFENLALLLLAHNTQATITALGCAIFTMSEKFRKPAYRPIRVAMYSFLGLSAFVPVAHGVLVNGWAMQNEQQSVTYFIGLGLLNFTGAAIYAARIPERWYPRAFDIYGSSHQIMHVLVMCGAWSWTQGLAKAFDYWHLRAAMQGGSCRTD